MKKLLAILLSTVLLAGTLAACGNDAGAGSEAAPASTGGDATAADDGDADEAPVASGEKTTIVFSTGAPDDAWRTALEFFMDTANEKLAEKNIEVVAEYYPSEEEMWKTLPAQIVSGSAPDLVGLNNEGVLELIVNGTLAPLDDLIATVGLDTDALDPANYNGWKYEGKQYAVPLTTTISCLAVNMTMLKEAGIEQAPATMDELVAAAIATTDKDNGVYGVCVNLHEFHVSQYVHAYNGGWSFGDNMTNEGNQTGLQLIVDLFNEYEVAATPAQLGVNGDTDAFAAGKAAMTTAGPWYVATMRDKDVDFEWSMVPIPTGTAQQSTLYGWAFTMLESCENKEAAMEVIKAMTSDECYQYLVEPRGDIPAKSEYVPDYEALYPEMAVVLGTADDATAFEYPVAANRFKSDLVTGLESIIFQGDKTVEQLLEDMDADGYKS